MIRFILVIYLEETDIMWKVLNSEYIIKQKWLTARKDHVRLCNGNEIEDYYVLEYPHFVNIIAITKENEIVLIRQYRHAIGAVNYELPAGVMDRATEKPIEAARRELLEETGYGKGEWSLFMQSAPNPSSMTNYNYTFLAKNVEKIGSQKLEPTEELELCLMPINKLKLLLNNNHIIQAMMLAPLWKLIALIENKKLINNNYK